MGDGSQNGTEKATDTSLIIFHMNMELRTALSSFFIHALLLHLRTMAYSFSFLQIKLMPIKVIQVIWNADSAQIMK